MTFRSSSAALQLAIIACLAGVVEFGLGAVANAEVLLEDNFATYNPDLGELAAGQSVKDNALVISLDAETWNRKFYQSKRFGDVDAVIRVRMPNFLAKEGASVGLMFWAVDSGDFYALTLNDEGGCGVQHYCRGKWYAPVVFRQVQGLKVAPGSWNELRIVTQGPVATAYVNGQQFVILKGRPPQGGGLIGMLTSPGAKPLTAEFSALKVVRPTGEPPVKLAADAASVIYAMDPAFQDPAWNLNDTSFGWKDGRMFLTTPPGTRKWKQYFGDGAAALSIQAQVRLEDGGAADSAAAVGVQFWAVSNADFYLFMVNANGTTVVLHFLNGAWSRPAPPDKTRADAKVNLREWTNLRGVISPTKAAFFLNDFPVSDLSSTIVRPEAKFGVALEADKTAARAEFAMLKVNREP